MAQLVTQRVETVEYFPQHACGFAITQGLCGAAFTAGEARLPFFFCEPAVAAIPEALEYKGVVQEIAQANAIMLGRD